MKSVTWKYNYNDIDQPGITVSGDELTIEDVNPKFEGIYTCDGTTVHTRTSTFIRLVVVCK